ncbi:MAG: hypothetical protein GF308_07390 [Candidatus Heimdallarchaeota archaeon]|nr:hypothetical protein [Candidatus Heimdallarchaeota archaeon]
MTSFLSWKNDPLLFDKEPTTEEHWLTANDLIEQQQRGRIFQQKEQLDLYPIMVRRVDFTKGERTLQAMPYLVLDSLWAKKLRKQSLALAERCAYYFADSPAECSIKQWQKKIINYTEQQERIPLPMFRLATDWEAFFSAKEAIAFQSARGENFQLPQRLTNKLAYILGVVLGDGHLSEYAIYIVDYLEEYIRYLAAILEQLFGADILLYPHTQCNAWNLCQKGKWLVRLIHFLSGQPIAGKKYETMCEPLLVKEQKNQRASFWRGLMDTDGSYKNDIIFCSASGTFVKEFSLFLQENKIGNRSFKINSQAGKGYGLRIPAWRRKKFVKLLRGSQHPEKSKQLHALLERTRKRSDSSGTSEQDNNQNDYPPPKIWKKYWVETIRKDRTIELQNNLYFDFSYLPKLRIEVTETVQALLEGITQGVKKKLGITRQRIYHFKKGITHIPLCLLEELLANLLEPQELMLFLREEKITSFYSGKASAQLPLQPSHHLEKTLQGTRLRGNIITSASSMKEEFAKVFGIRVTKKRISNSIIKSFLTTFMTLKEETKTRK